MSATTSALQPTLRFQTKIKAACFVPLSYFERCLDLPRYTSLRVFGLIMVETIGASTATKPKEVEIPIERFTELFAVTRESIYDALSELEGMGMIQIRTEDRGPRSTVKLYSIAEEYVREAKDAGRRKVPGKCPDCHAIGLFSSEFIPLPHTALRKLGGCVPSAVFRAVMVVCRYTLKWNKDNRCIDVEPHELNLDDFTRCTGLEKREITDALTVAAQLGLISREMRPGKPSLFWVIPEHFGALRVRAQREVSQPTKEKAKSAPSKTSETPNKSEKTLANESRPYFFAKCPNCNHFVDVIAVSEEEIAASQPLEPPGQEKRPPRAGPTRETKPAKSKLSNFLDAFEAKYANE